jgi:hypothetical protein
MVRRILPILLSFVLYQSVESAKCDQYYFYWDRHSVSIIDKDTGQLQGIFADSVFIIDNGFGRNINSSCTGRYISITCLRSPEVKMEKGLPVPHRQVAVIVDLMDQDKWIMEDVEKVSWAPHSDLFVCIGGPSLNLLDYYYSDKAWLVNPGTKAVSILFPNQAAFDDINWSAHNSRIYSCRSGVLEYNSENGTIRHTGLKRCNISPDGDYYMDDTEEDEEACLYRTATNSEVEIEVPDNDAFSFGRLFSHFAWQMDESRTLAYVMDYPDFYCIDCATGKMYKVIPPSPDIHPIKNLVGFRQGRPVWAKITGDKAELFYY